MYHILHYILKLLHTDMDHNECSNEYWKENLGKVEVNRSFEQIDQITAASIAPKRFYRTFWEIDCHSALQQAANFAKPNIGDSG